GEDDPSDVISFRGTVFPHASGALLLDERGRAFGLIVRNVESINIPIINLTTERLRRIQWESNRFSAFPLRQALEKIKAIPPTSAAQVLIDRLISKGDDDDFKYGLQRNDITPVDTIHLIDTLFVSGL